MNNSKLDKFEVYKRKYENNLRIIKKLQENHKQAWKFTDVNLGRIENLCLEENAIGGLSNFESEILSGDPVREKLWETYKSVFPGTMDMPSLWVKSVERAQNYFFEKGLIKNGDMPMYEIQSYFSNIYFFEDLSFKFVLKDLMRQPRVITEKTYNYLNSTPKEQIFENLVMGYCEYALKRNPDEPKDLLDSMIKLHEDISQGTVKPTEYNNFWK